MSEQQQQRQTANLWSGFESKAHLLRFIAVCGAFMGFLTICCVVLFYVFGISVASPSVRIGIEGSELSEGPRQILFTKSGLQIEMRSGETFATTLVPANKLWISTNIVVQPGSRIRLAASGSANLNQAATLDARRAPGEQNLNSLYHLFDPHGQRLDNRDVPERPANRMRRPIALMPSASLGTLVGIVAEQEDLLREVRPPASRLFAIQSAEEPSGGYLYRGAHEGTLFLAVNDLVVSDAPRAREYWLLRRRNDHELFSPAEIRQNIQGAYLAPNASQREVDDKIRWAESLWDTLVRLQYYNYFYEDNAGYYMVSISVTPPPGD
jgi:hypothetical protein